MKPFDQHRIIESYDTLKQFEANTEIKVDEVTVICRKEDSLPEVKNTVGGIYLGKLQYQDITYQFVEIYSWIISQLARLTSDARVAFYMKLNDYISDPNTSEQVKLLWQALHKN